MKPANYPVANTMSLLNIQKLATAPDMWASILLELCQTVATSEGEL
jgi:hypothetical protein